LDKGVNGLELELGPEINVVGITDLLDKLAAVTARGGGDSEIVKVGLGIEGEIGEEKLLSVDWMVDGEAGELEVDAEEDTITIGGAEPYDTEVVGGDGQAEGTSVWRSWRTLRLESLAMDSAFEARIMNLSLSILMGVGILWPWSWGG
jgi:hypothetical protein